MSNKIAVAMSGGVDSSVAAALCVEKYGKENVFGVTMKLFCYDSTKAGSKSCCSLDAINDAKSVCDQLDIAHYVVNMEKEFEKTVISDFVNEYKAGHTPNPCIQCNRLIKFDYLIKKAETLGADYLATGHYARIAERDNTAKLLRGTDKGKDQSYFLYGIKKENLKKILFPVGDISKTETRKIAAKLNLKTAEKKESQEICFVTGRVEDYLREKIKSEKGDIVDARGKKMGEHSGIFEYTIGQRKGLGGGFATPMYVVGVDKNKRQVTVGDDKDLLSEELMAKNINWLVSVQLPIKCTAKIRYRVDDSKCSVDENGLVVFEAPQRAITPGQSIVFYDNEIVLGGGVISD